MKAIVFFLSALAIVGCTPKERIVTKTEYVLVAPELSYLVLTKVPAPTPMPPLAPNQLPDFEGLYTNAGFDMIDLYSAIEQCNNDKRAITKDIQTKRQVYGR